MKSKTLKALTNTIIKSVPQQSSTLNDSQKFPLDQGETLLIKQYRSAANNHWEIQLENPHKGQITWFAYISHVEIFIDPQFKEKLVKTAINEWEFFGEGSKKETMDGFWQRVVKYWKEAKVNRNDIDSAAEVGSPNNAWSAAFISWLMTAANAADKFTRHANHSVYIREAVKKRKEKTKNAPFIAYKVSEVTPEVGDLVCAPRAADATKVTYDTTRQYSSHCDLVVAKRPNEIDMIGGNVRNSVSMTTTALNTKGQVIPNGKMKINGQSNGSKRPWFVVIKNLL